MPRTARLIAPGHPHHVTHRGHARHRVFFEDQDYRNYLRILHEETRRNDVAIWAYCLMPNHAHLVMTPATPAGLSKAVGETARRFARASNGGRDRRGPVWQSRFYSVALDERHLLEAVRYILLNPVRAGLRESADRWRWSSFGAHRTGSDDLIDTAPLAGRIRSIESFVAIGTARDIAEQIRAATRSGRPLGEKNFVEELALSRGVTISDRPRGRPPSRAKFTAP